MKLTYKLFSVLLTTIIFVVILMTGAVHYFAFESFEDYVAKDELRRMSGICDVLKAEYRKNDNWNFIRNNRLLWDQIIRDHQPEGIEDDQQTSTGPPPPGMPTYKDPTKPLPPPAPIISRRMTLYDAEKRYVIGRSEEPDKQDLREIALEGKTVGWFGLSRRKTLPNPLQLAFIFEQKSAVLLIGGLFLVYCVIIALMLSRMLLRPIQKIGSGMHTLASRRFDIRLAIHSSDELGLLAHDFNILAATLERNELTRRQWIADISHELRTPLAVLLGEIEAILDGVRDARRETLNSLHTEILLLKKIVDDLHTLTVIESEALTMVKEPVPALHVVQNMLKVFQPRFTEKGIIVNSILESNEEVMVMGDSDRLAQVFSNLFENSLRYTDAPGRFTILYDRDGDMFRLTMEDSAPGVPDSAIPFLFDRLYRVEQSRSRAKGGSGLGLAIAKTIVESHGGRITASPSTLGGLRIEISLPLVKKTRMVGEGRL